MILDTNALSDMVYGNPSLLKVLRTSRQHAVPVIVLGEFRFGALGSRSKDELLKWVSRLEAETAVLDVTTKTAFHYAKVRQELRTLGKPIPENDVWIAAMAIEHGLALASQDSHFDYVPGVLRVGW